jgi:gamma-glutamyltranspeptidase/glutathione hydrolase
MPAPATEAEAATSVDPPVPDPPLPTAGGTKAAASARGMVSSVESQATEAGVRILAAGGNAADAAVAVAYALAVTHPSAGNLGGGGLALVRSPEGPTVAVDFREKAPRALTREHFGAMIARGAVGPAAVGVPGTVAGLELLHDRFGRLSRDTVLAPALDLALKGHRVGRRQALTIQWAWPDLKKDRVARGIFGRGGRPLPNGALLIQPDLGATLRRISDDGAKGFYEGATASLLARSIAQGGLVTEGDLRSYTAVLREPLAFDYRGVRVEVAPPPSAGGVAVAQMLKLREHYRGWQYPPDSADAIHLFVEIARRAHSTRRFDVVDPDSLESFAVASKRREWLDMNGLVARFAPVDMSAALASARVHPLYEAAVQELENTTHLSVVDGDGMAVSLTTTLSAGFGAKVVAEGTGVVLNNAVAAFGTAGADVPEPERRMTTSMSPTLLIHAERTVAVLGSPGGDTIPNTVTELVIRLIDEGLTVDRAVEAPRFHHGFVPDEIRYEKDRPLPKAVIDELRKRGHAISKKQIPIGDANVIVLRDGTAYGYADTREGGLATGPAIREP